MLIGNRRGYCMFWDVDFAVASFAVIFIIVIFYTGETKLPVHRYKIFNEILSVSLAALIWDILTAWVNHNLFSVPLPIVQIVNIIYYGLIAYRSFIF